VQFSTQKDPHVPVSCQTVYRRPRWIKWKFWWLRKAPTNTVLMAYIEATMELIPSQKW